MAEPNSPPASCVRLSGDNIPTAAPNPYPPSPLEAKCYYYGLPSQPRLVARSSTDVWVEPTGPEAYLRPKESHPIGRHPLREIWEDKVGPAMVDYLGSKGVKWTSLDPVRMGYAGESSPPVIIWMGAVPGSLSAEDGIEVATHCKSILSAHNIDDVHVEIRESVVTHSADPKMYKPLFSFDSTSFDSTAQVQEHSSTTLGLSICAEATPSIEGTGGFFISDPHNPGKIYLVTARHVVFHPDEDSNELYQHHCDSSQPSRNVLLFGDAGIEKQITAIKTEISDKHLIIEHLENRLEYAVQRGGEIAVAEQNDILPLLEEAKEAIGALEEFLTNVSRDWKKRENRVLGHVVLSPPISLGVGEEGFTEDWAVIEIDNSKVDLTNFVGNAIELGITIPVYNFMVRMSPINPSLFNHLGDHLLQFDGTISDEEIWKPSPKTHENDNNNGPCIMVIKRGSASDLTVGHLNTIRSFTRVYFKDQLGQVSKEITVLPRSYKSGAFSKPGDSGSAVVDGKGRIAGLLIGGAGSTEAFESDCTYLTSINFLLKRMSEQHGLQADLLPSLKA
ncbi:hypothetical protein FRC14_007526 [Serendipita sp. 396]|nr:hypothetical protein FRC14_007526 [Serendipita sp. 396]KAG8777910.1 hypothetical protein FRC15_011057 [Serendipita sp. 397]KAG8795217.1 hypothetical protein FRC16_010168 [Serendipita sp. 398]KAG8807238.1 hypothetical protein FRC18_005659 [Serendipita sp. 400]KAG8852981.1 hypothetical protein FRC20_001360 [Serendipita sp. 405]